MNFKKNRELKFKKLDHPVVYPAAEGDPVYPVFS